MKAISPTNKLMMQSFLYNCKINMFKKMFELDKCNTSPRIETITLSDLKQEELEVLLISSIAMAQWFERKGRNMCDHSIVQPTNMSSST
ncbi:hypothetical protein IGI04_035358 [Brassica rapa subsp. trilocularis]|uniref:Uncharacterized protein n=1 Tax=Brassica rapa subsp. trilocularis TaxID=1813537 RepID=A0ABQ7LBG9_BRACM|nr:hypothetical protein IGI04_035358 [Brassica rapa subsp. trilocularis]